MVLASVWLLDSVIDERVLMQRARLVALAIVPSSFLGDLAWHASEGVPFLVQSS